MSNLKKVELCGVIKVSNLCLRKKPCLYCGFIHQGNSVADIRLVDSAFFTGEKEVLKQARELDAAGVDWVFLVTGWLGKRLPGGITDYIELIKANTKLKVMVAFGELDRESLARLKNAGVDRYTCKLETVNRELFKSIKPGDSLDERITTIRECKDIGLEVESGIIVGIGEKQDDYREAAQTFKDLQVEAVHISLFDPAFAAGSPMAGFMPGNENGAILFLQYMRSMAGDGIDIRARCFPEEKAPFWVNAGVNIFSPVTVKNASYLKNFSVKWDRH